METRKKGHCVQIIINLWHDKKDNILSTCNEYCLHIIALLYSQRYCDDSESIALDFIWETMKEVNNNQNEETYM